MLSDGIYSLLTGAAPIVALLGTPAARKDKRSGVFPALMPIETPLPAIVVTQMGGSGVATMDGANAFHRARYQLNCFGKNFEDAKRLQVTVKRFLEGIKPQTLSEGTELQCALLELELEAFEDAPGIFSAPIDFTFSYQDSGS